MTCEQIVIIVCFNENSILIYFLYCFQGKIEASEVQIALKQLGVSVDKREADSLTKR